MKTKMKIAPGFLLVRPLVIKPKTTFGKTNIINVQTTAKDSEFEQIEEIFDKHPFQAEVIQLPDHQGGFLVHPKEWIQEGDLLLLNAPCTKNDAVLIQGQGVFGYIRPHMIIGVIPKSEWDSENPEYRGSKIKTDHNEAVDGASN